MVTDHCTLREIDIADYEWAQAILSLQRKSYQIEADLINFQEIPPLIEGLDELMQADETFIIAGTLSELKGMIAVEPDHPNSLIISRLCVNPEFLRQGLASEMINHVIRFYKEYSKIKVSTGAANQPAIDCYQKAGFRFERFEFLEKHQLSIVHLTFEPVHSVTGNFM